VAWVDDKIFCSENVICGRAEVEWSCLPYLTEEGNGFCTDNGLSGSRDKCAHGFGLAVAA